MTIANVLAVAKLSETLKFTMYELYSQFYQATQQDLFLHDLAQKNYVVLLWNTEQQLVGFSTLAIYDHPFANEQLKIVYSGDTIVSPAYWNQTNLAFTWLKFVGRIKAQFPTQKLFWFLIVKGHRTYRYLSVLSRQYFPCYHISTPIYEQELITQLAQEKFGSIYDPLTGIVHYAQSQGELIPKLAAVPLSTQQKPEVKFFLSKNPGYTHGDELVCLCELAPENLQPIARRCFEQGMSTSDAYATIL